MMDARSSCALMLGTAMMRFCSDHGTEREKEVTGGGAGRWGARSRIVGKAIDKIRAAIQMPRRDTPRQAAIRSSANPASPKSSATAMP
jgi:hypothetical protein